MPENTQLAVVTGASSGIGYATVRTLAERGFHVLAGVRSETDAQRLSGQNVEGVTLDITNPAHVAAIARRIGNDAAGRPLAALVNNAGVALNAPIETLPIEEWRRHFEVNFFGHVAVTQALLPALVAGRGRVVNISSIGGRVAFPTYGAYAASKFALEAVSDVLRREVGRYGVHVIVIEPGTVNSAMWGKGLTNIQEVAAAFAAGASDAEKARYSDLLAAMTKQAEANVRNGNGVDPARVAAVIADAIQARRPRTRYLVGRDAKLLARITAVLPDRTFDRVVARNLGLRKPSAPTAASQAATSRVLSTRDVGRRG
jgi:NAD(P)-dependent dehydrogenase (short-subunit alcohol dehydrogenase family)